MKQYHDVLDWAFRPLPLSDSNKMLLKWTCRVVPIAVFGIIAANSWNKSIFQAANAKKLDAYSAIASDVNFGEILIDASTNAVVGWNAGMTKWTGWTKSEMLGQPIDRINGAKGDKISDYKFAAEDSSELRGAIRGHLVLTRKDGSQTKDLFAIMRQVRSKKTGTTYRIIRVDDNLSTLDQTFVHEINPSLPLDRQGPPIVDFPPEKIDGGKPPSETRP